MSSKQGRIFNPVISAAGCGDLNALKSALIGMDPDAAWGGGGERALHIALRSSFHRGVRVLLAMGASPKSKNSGRPPLSEAVIAGNVLGVRLLMKAGADPLEVSGGHPRPLDIACLASTLSRHSWPVIEEFVSWRADFESEQGSISPYKILRGSPSAYDYFLSCLIPAERARFRGKV